MSSTSHYRLSFPHMGNYEIPIITLASMLDCEIMVPPKMTQHTLEVGVRHSPEFVCIPFKYNLGNYIESLDRGANLLVQAGGGCRFGFYGEVQEAILRDLGYEFDMLRLVGDFDLKGYYRGFKKINPRLTFRSAMHHYRLALAQTRALDSVEDVIRKRSGFETERGSFDAVHERFLRDLRTTESIAQAEELSRDTIAQLEALPIERPDDMLRVGIVGELYVLMEPFSNFYVERELAKRGVEVHRFVTVSEMISHSGMGGDANLRNLIELASPYATHHLGAHGTESVAMAHKLIKDGFDGVLHLKPFGCMPEVNAMTALQRMSREYTFPILFLSYDAQTSQTGVQTRLEAFCDMLRMRKRGHATTASAEEVPA